MSSGALTPGAAVESIYHDALHHLDEPAQLAFLKNVAGGIQVGLAGLTSLVVAGGCHGIKQSNPGLTNFIQGSIFSTGLILVYFTGAELFTGYPMWLAIAALQRKRRPMQYVRASLNALSGNLVGALLSASLFSYASQALSEDPWKSYVTDEIDKVITNSEWHIIFIKAISCGYLVTLAMLLGTQNLDGVSKAMALWLPFTLATSCQFPHTVEFMHLVPTGMMLGASLSVGGFLWKCMLPVILGNTVGGAIFTGTYHWWVFLHCKNGEEKSLNTFGDTITQYRDEEDDD